MKNAKKLLSLLLVFVLSISLTAGYEAKAATTTNIRVTLRIEQDFSTMLTPVSVTLTSEDKEKNFGIEALANTMCPLKAYAKYLSTEKKVTDNDMSKYINATSSGWLLGLNLTGDNSNACGVDANVYWMFSVNDKAFMDTNKDGSGDSIVEYQLSNNDSIVIYGAYSTYNMETGNYFAASYTHFDQPSYEVKTGQSLSVTLTEENTDATYTKNVTSPCKNASILATACTDKTSFATKDSPADAKVTNNEGKTELKFTKSGKYVLSAYKSSDKVHNDISRPYAVVTVTDEVKKEPQKPANITNNTTQNSSVVSKNTIKKPAKVKKVKAVVKKAKTKKKKITITWKKVKNASGYQIFVSKKKKTGFKKAITVSKTKAVMKKKKGTYYIKVRAYNKSGKTKKYGNYSSTIKVKVK